MITLLQFQTIQAEAERTGLPRGFGRAILREYLQCEIINILSGQSGSEKLALIGGTGLRLLYDLDRFSEDLDFDNCGLSPAALTALLAKLVAGLKKEKYLVSWKAKSAGTERGGRLVFPGLLFTLGLSPHRDESLTIKIEYTSPRPVPATTTAVLNRFGFAVTVTTEPLPALCARKLLALRGRKRLQPRDLYDLSWLLARRIRPDEKTLKDFGVRSIAAFRGELISFLEAHRTKFAQYERDLQPLVLHPEKVAAISLLPRVLAEVLR